MTDDDKASAPADIGTGVDARALGRAAHRRVEDWARRTPNQTALHVDGVMITYAALSRRTGELAYGMAGTGVHPGDRVGLLLHRGPDLIASLLAVLSLGAAYVPLDPRLPETRLAGMVTDAHVSLIVTDVDAVPTWASSLPTNAPVVSIAVLTQGAPADPAHTPRVTADDPDVALDQLAYILFTSGSTGRPKGVEITHANLCHILDAWDDVAGPASNGRPAVHLFHSTIAFDASLTEFLWPLTVGRAVAVAPERDSGAGLRDGLGALIEGAGVTHVQCTPTRAVLMLADPDDRRSLRGVDHVLVGGEVLSTSLAHELFAAGVGRLTNIYGPTECSIWSLSQPVAPTISQRDGTTIPIGRPLRGVGAVVVDSELQAVADGIAGELLIVGEFVGRGYAGRPDLTAERFVELDVDERRERCYRTGDMVVRRPDDTYTYHGRIDTQVKLRGHRIELGEIESAMAGLPGVRQAVVILDRGEDDHTSDKLVALVVRRPMTGESAESPVAPSDAVTGRAWEDAIRRQLATRLPSLMVPTRVLAVDSFVRTPSGKVDRTLLEARARLLLQESGSASPRPTSSDPLAAMIGDLGIVLDRSDVGPDDDFFALGGHSLQGVHLVARIRERTGIELPLRVLLDAPTARTLVTVLAQPDGTSEVTPLVRFGAAVSDRRLYLVHGAGGHVLGFRDLALAMRSDVELVGIQARGIEPGRPPDRTLDEMAERYVVAIMADDPDGPYDVGGYSDGGTIAIRLAHDLRRQGREVRSLVLLDTFVLRPLRATHLGRLVSVVRNAINRSGQPFASWARNSAAAWRARHSGIDAPAERAAALGYIGLGDTIEQAVAGAPMLAPLDVPTLLVRSTYHNPVQIFDYAVAASSSTDVTNAWIDAPHLEVFGAGAVEGLSQTIIGFLRDVSLRPIDVAAPLP